MPKLLTLEETYDSCISSGCVFPSEEFNLEKVKLMLHNADTTLNSARIIAQAITKSAKEWMNVFTLHYDALRIYSEALLAFDKTKSSNHQCIFAALCIKFPSLELDWNFFESVRTKRNGINYYGQDIKYTDWKALELQMNLYLSRLRKEIIDKIDQI